MRDELFRLHVHEYFDAGLDVGDESKRVDILLGSKLIAFVGKHVSVVVVDLLISSNFDR